MQQCIDTLAFSGIPAWRHVPGELVVRSAEQRDGAANQLMLPELTHVASDEFLEFHCFRYAGRKSWMASSGCASTSSRSGH